MTGRDPAAIARVLDDGSSQITQFTYNSKRRITSQIDPLGRQTNYTYASNEIDLLSVEQVRSGGTDVLASFSNYNAHFQPQTVTDGAGNATTIAYNSVGQPLTITNAKSETTTFTYQTSTYYPLTVTGAVTGSTTTLTYDDYGRVETV